MIYYKVVLFDPKIGIAVFDHNLTKEEADKAVDKYRKEGLGNAYHHAQLHEHDCENPDECKACQRELDRVHKGAE